LTEMFIALWWVPAGHRPSIEEAMVRLEHLRRHGPSPHAFTFTQTYPPQETTSGQARGPGPMAQGRTQNSITPGR
jgi:Domain of unknown function (DUF3291)